MKKGSIIFPSNFDDIGNVEAVKKSLLRLKNKKFLVRIAHGIYLYPKQDKLLGILYPSIEEIANAIAIRDKARIIPTGIKALNQLGLSNQIPRKFYGKTLSFDKLMERIMELNTRIKRI